MEQIQFRVLGTPVGKGRPRVTRYCTYTPQKTKDYEELVRQSWLFQSNKRADEGIPLRARISVHFLPPKSLSMKKRTALFGKPHTHKPDMDNLIKSILDALNGYAYKDDSAIAEIVATKDYQSTECVEVTIEEI